MEPVVILGAQEMAKAIGLLIRTARERQGLSRADLGQYVGLSASGFARLERGENGITIQRLVAVAHALGLTFHDLIPPATAQEMVEPAAMCRALVRLHTEVDYILTRLCSVHDVWQ